MKESALRQESLLVLVIQQLFHGVPAQHCALYAGRHVGETLRQMKDLGVDVVVEDK